MNLLRWVCLSTLLCVQCIAQQPELGIGWEQQIRPWVGQVPRPKTAEVLIRYYPGGEEREELFALYRDSEGEVTIAHARTREINAQSFSNTFINELQQTPPPIPIDLKSGRIRKREISALISDVQFFLHQSPKSWQMLAQMGHGGSIFVMTGGSSYLYEGPIDSRGGLGVTRVLSRLDKIRSLLGRVRSIQLFDYPAVKQLTQWRFCRALIQGDEQLSIHLLSLGASPNLDPRFPASPIEHAIRGEKRILLSTLLNLGADPKEKTSEGLTPRELALELKKGWATQMLEAALHSDK